MHVTILTPGKTVMDAEDAEHIVLPAANGELGILPGHIDMVCALRKGRLRVELADEHVEINATEGFAEVSGERVTVFVSSAEQV